MNRPLAALAVVIALAGCGGSSASTSDPATACKSLFTTVCNKLFQCNPTGAAQAYGSSSACASSLSAGCNSTSGSGSCPAGTSYNASNANTCINDYGNESCADMNGGVTPASCSKVCS